MGPATDYGGVPRDDVATVLAELVREPHGSRFVLELTSGATTTVKAVTDVR
ncbi:hypothetical protein [Streptomyces sp. NPDC051001]|uniref:hypothetical protein n=1 Tax=Streptomyces sp. NPDC051001 TaxID=3155795 RepID=UPI0034424E1D